MERQASPRVNIKLHYIQETDSVEIGLKVNDVPVLILGDTPWGFLEFVGKLYVMAMPFIERMKQRLEEGEAVDISVELTPGEWDKLLDLKKKLKENEDG